MNLLTNLFKGKALLFLCLLIFRSTLFSNYPVREIIQHKHNNLVSNQGRPCLNSKVWCSILSEIMIAYSQAKSEQEISAVDKAFQCFLSGKYASNILFLESLKDLLKKANTPHKKQDKIIRNIFEKIVYQNALLFASEENKKYLSKNLSSACFSSEKPTVNPLTLESIRDKIKQKLKKNEFKLFDPEGHLITDLSTIQHVLERVNVAVAIPSYREGKDIQNSVRQVFLSLKDFFSNEQIVLLGNFYHKVPEKTTEAFESEMTKLRSQNRKTNIYTITVSTGYDENGTAIRGKGNNFRNFFEILWLSKKHGSLKGAATIDADLRTEVIDGKEQGITKLWVKKLLYPIIYPEQIGLKKAIQFTIPFYSRHEYDGGMTNNCCIGFVKLASNLMIRQPIGGDFGFSPETLEKFLFDLEWNEATRQYGIDISMTLIAAINQLDIAEVELGTKLHASSEGKAFRIATEVFSAAVRLLSYKKNSWIHLKGNQKVLHIGNKEEVKPKNLFVDYLYYKTIFHQFLGKSFEKKSLEKDFLSAEEFLQTIEDWGLNKQEICSLFPTNKLYHSNFGS